MKIFIASLILVFVSCGEFDTLEYNKKIRKSADSLFRKEKPLLDKIGDSICLDKKEEYKNSAIDSLKISRLLEIEKLIKEQ